MSQNLSSAASSIQSELLKLGLQCEVRELPSSTRTALDAASSIGCDIKQILKSLIFKTKNTHQPVLVLASGANQVDLHPVEIEIGERITKADADFVREITGFAIGGIPPIGHKTPIEFIYIDKDLLKCEEVWAAAGTPNAVFCMKIHKFLEAMQGKVLTLSLKESV